MGRGWEQVQARVVLDNPRLTVREDDVRSPGGADRSFTVGVTGDAVSVVAVADDGRVVLVRQHRYPVGQWTLEVPAGGLPPGADPLAQARAELAEETGATATTWTELGRFFPMPGRLDARFHVFLATGFDGARLGAPEPSEDEWIDEIVLASIDELGAMVAAGEICDGCSLAALALWRAHR